MKKLIKWGVIAFVGLMVLGAIAGGGKNTTTTTQPVVVDQANVEQTKSEPASTKQVEQIAQIAKVGDTVIDSDLAFTVTGVTTAKSLGNQYTKSDAQGTFYIITLKVENKSKETKTIDSSMLKVTDSQKRQFERSIEGQTAKGLAQGKVDMFLQQVQPSLSVTGDIVFDLPTDIQDPKLIVKGNVFGSGKEISLVK